MGQSQRLGAPLMKRPPDACLDDTAGTVGGVLQHVAPVQLLKLRTKSSGLVNDSIITFPFCTTIRRALYMALRPKRRTVSTSYGTAALAAVPSATDSKADRIGGTFTNTAPATPVRIDAAVDMSRTSDASLVAVSTAHPFR